MSDFNEKPSDPYDLFMGPMNMKSKHQKYTDHSKKSIKLQNELVNKKVKKNVVADKELIIKEPEKKICSSCGNILEDDALFCGLCGKAKKKSKYIPASVRKVVYERDGGECRECGSKEYLEYDHILPFSKGGSSSAGNIQLLCENCNRSKYNKI